MREALKLPLQTHWLLLQAIKLVLQAFYDLSAICFFYKKMAITTDNILSEITTTLKQFGIEKIILFGSYAYGVPNKDSDIDLLVIKNIPENETRDFRIKLKKDLWLKLGKLTSSYPNVRSYKYRISTIDIRISRENRGIN